MVIFSFITMAIITIGFGDMSINLIYFVGNYFTIILSLFLTYFISRKLWFCSTNVFINRIFYFSLTIRIFAVIFIYILFNIIIGADLSIEEYDAVFYDVSARNISLSLKNGNFNLLQFLLSIPFDDSGYVLILSAIYTIIDSVFFAKIVQAIVDSLSVILLYKIGKKIFTEDVGRSSALIASTFLPMIMFSTLHTKETFMVYFLLVFIKNALIITSSKWNFVNMLSLAVSLIFLFSFRIILAEIVLFGFILFFLINIKYISPIKIFYAIFPVIVIILVFIYIDVFKDVYLKMGAYIGLNVEKSILTGGTDKQFIVDHGQKFGMLASAPLLIWTSISSPFPSMIKTNIAYYNLSMQWFFMGGVVIWNYISYYVYCGLYYSLKRYLKKSLLLLFISLTYTVSLISSLYITSIRYNIIKIILFIIFLSVGVRENKHNSKLFVLYVIIMSIIIILWNYIKLAGRGLI